jgi:hypothetical protein
MTDRELEKYLLLADGNRKRVIDSLLDKLILEYNAKGHRMKNQEYYNPNDKCYCKWAYCIDCDDGYHNTGSVCVFYMGGKYGIARKIESKKCRPIKT